MILLLLGSTASLLAWGTEKVTFLHNFIHADLLVLYLENLEFFDGCWYVLDHIHESALGQSSSCLGRSAKPTHAPSIDDYPSKGLQYQGQLVEKPSLSDDFWGTSTGDMDNPIGLSQRSISSLSTSNVSFHSDLGSASMNSYNDFVNHGLLLWTQLRLQWIGATKLDDDHQALGPAISLNATYDSLLSSRERFRRPIPLSEMVDFLVDVWEQEGLYD